MDNIQNQNWSYLALYYLDTIIEEQEETEEMIKQFFRGKQNANTTTY